ncbi:MAG TPA: nuclear transport factor 2 family protein, partial [Anaerolineae bacterium]|nr:nuclear transport factor 2 family protein [Anaerolineae bacterium]
MKKRDIYDMIEQWVDAWNAKDMDRMKSMYTKDAVLYQGPVREALKGWGYIYNRLQDLAMG